jgi:peroxiredoxin
MGDFLLECARLALIVVLLAAGVSKLLDLRGSRAAVRDLGLPARLAAPLGILVPIGEIVVALILCSAGAARLAALLAVLLLVAFTCVIALNLVKGRHPSCHCFGALDSSALGLRTLARNMLLTAVAAVVAVDLSSGSPDTVWGALRDASAIELAGTALVVFVFLGLVIRGESLLVFARRNRWLRDRIDALELRVQATLFSARRARTGQRNGLEIGTEAPEFALASLSGAPVPLSALRGRGAPVLLVFVDPNCDVCEELLPDVETWSSTRPGSFTVALVSQGTVEENVHKFSGHRIETVLIQETTEVLEAYAIAGPPSAVAVDARGVIASRVAAGPDAVRELAMQLVGQQASTAAV